MTGHRHKHRVRVVTDRAKHRRHQLKKLLRRAGKVALWAGAVLLCILVIWYVLDVLFRPRPLPQ